MNDEEITNIDTQITRIYNFAYNSNPIIPVEFVLIDNKDNSDSELYSLIDIINEGKYESYKDLITSSITIRDITMVIYMLLLNTADDSEKIREEVNKTGYKQYDTIEEIEKDYKRWNKRFNELVDKTRYRVDVYSYVVDNINNIDNIISTPIQISGGEMSFTPNNENGDIIFDGIITSDIIPYVKYVKENDEVLYKIYRDGKMKNKIKSIHDKFSRYNDKNSIYFIIMLEDDNSTVRYNISNKYMLVETVINGNDYKDIIMKILTDDTDIDLSNGKIANVKANFELWNIPVTEEEIQEIEERERGEIIDVDV